MKNNIKIKPTIEQSEVKLINKANILKAFRENNVLQKQDIVKLLNLSITTVTSNINLLLDEGYIENTGIAKSTGGRKPVVLEFQKNSRYSIGVNISPHNVSIIVTNLLSEIICKTTFDTLDNYAFDDLLSLIGLKIHELMDEYNINKSRCLGVGISVPGIVDEDKLLLVNAPNLNITSYDFNNFQSDIGMKVFLENEANTGAYAELILGLAKNRENMVYVSITDGVGCGIITSNKLYKSTYKKAGEFGHMRVSDKGIKCSCGRSGCWENFASERALFRYYKSYSNIETLDLKEVFDKYREGDTNSRQALIKYYKYLSLGIENIIMALDPELVIVGGEICSYLLDIKSDFYKYFHLNSNFSSKDQNEIKISKLKDNGSLLGASLLPLAEVFRF